MKSKHQYEIEKLLIAQLKSLEMPNDYILALLLMLQNSEEALEDLMFWIKDNNYPNWEEVMQMSSEMRKLIDEM